MLLSLEHVAKTHHVGPYAKPTLLDVSLTLDTGELVGVWGGRRAGKSTLLRLSSGLDVPDEGSVRFDGTDLACLSRSQLSRLRLHEVGLAFGQGPQSMDFTVAEYVELPLRTERSPAVAQRRVRDALRRVGILDRSDATWSQLSDSEQVLASLAHAVVRRPRLLLADDPVSKLDVCEDREVVGLLGALAAELEMAVLMTTSSLSVLPDVDQAYTLSDGRLEAVPSSRGSVIALPGVTEE